MDGTVSSGKKYMDGTVPSSKKYLDGTVPSSKKLVDGTVPSCKKLVDGTFSVVNIIEILQNWRGGGFFLLLIKLFNIWSNYNTVIFSTHFFRLVWGRKFSI